MTTIHTSPTYLPPISNSISIKVKAMKILKFGGTSVGSPQRMKDVCQLITDGERKIVVLSAMSGTTNSLVEIADYIKSTMPKEQVV